MKYIKIIFNSTLLLCNRYLHLRVVNFTEKNLSILITDSIGNPTTEKISQVLESYKNTKLHLIGCFIEENLRWYNWN